MATTVKSPSLVNFQVEHGRLHRAEGARQRLSRDRQAEARVPGRPVKGGCDGGRDQRTTDRRQAVGGAWLHSRSRVKPRGVLPRHVQMWLMVGHRRRDPRDHPLYWAIRSRCRDRSRARDRRHRPSCLLTASGATSSSSPLTRRASSRSCRRCQRPGARRSRSASAPARGG